MLSKRYLRVICYLGVVGVIIFTYIQVFVAPRSTLRNQKASQLKEETWLHTNNLNEAQGSKNIILNLGRKKCFHLGKLWKICGTQNDIFTPINVRVERTTIGKDLRGSHGFDWFGISEYLYYDTIKIASLSTLSLEEEMQVSAVASISDQETPGAYEWLDNVYVETTNLLASLKKKNSLLSEVTALFGDDCVDPRPDWNLEKSWTLFEGRFPSFISYKHLDLEEKQVANPGLRTRGDGSFKIVQLADLHFSVGKGECRDEFPQHENCDADPKTLHFIRKVLEIEDPDLVVFTGDQIMGDKSIQDSETALLKVLAPVIERNIPWALIWGNHDHEGSLSRWDISEFTTKLPYTMFSMSPKDTMDNSFGVGNYVIQAKDASNENIALTLYFLDSHSYSRSGKIYPGYDWIKEAQWEYMKEEYDRIHSEKIFLEPHLSMAFFHIPIPEYLNLESKKRPGEQNAVIGNFKEGVTAPKFNSGGIRALDYMGVQVTSCGHDHCNDYCVLDDSSSKDIWLCFGGGGGEGGYAGYGGTERRIRTYDIDTTKMSIYTWKRLRGSPNEIFDYQLMVSDGIPNAV